MAIVLQLLRRLAPWIIGAAAIGLLLWHYGSALETIGRLESERRDLLATNRANTRAIEQLGSEIARRERLHRDITRDLADARTQRQALQNRLERANADAPQAFRDCLAVGLPAEHVSLQLPADAD